MIEKLVAVVEFHHHLQDIEGKLAASMATANKKNNKRIEEQQFDHAVHCLSITASIQMVYIFTKTPKSCTIFNRSIFRKMEHPLSLGVAGRAYQNWPRYEL